MQSSADVTAQPPASRKKFVAELILVLKHHGLVLACAVAVLVYGIVLSNMTGHNLQLSFSSFTRFIRGYLLLAGIIVLFTAMILKMGSMILVERPKSPLRSMWHWIIFDAFSPSRLINGAFGMTAIFILVAGFTKAKNNVARFGSYNWDSIWAEVDRIIHGGFYPHELLRPLLGTPWATYVTDFAYWLWYPVLLSACFTASFQPVRSLTRHRFLVALILTWGIGGGVLSIVFSSGGPVYYSAFTSLPDPYAAHIAFLREVHAALPLTAVDIQNALWTEKANRNGLSMISAMPSMHVAITALIWIACQRSGPVLRVLVSAYAIMIVLGSIHLGWHYAVDSYVGIMIAVLSWQVALPVSRWYLNWTGTTPADFQ